MNPKNREINNADLNGEVNNPAEAKAEDQKWIEGKAFKEGFEVPKEAKKKRIWAKLQLNDNQISIFPRQMKFSINFPMGIKYKELKKILNSYNRFFKRFAIFMYEAGVPSAKTAEEADDAMRCAWRMYVQWWFSQAYGEDLEEEQPPQENNN